MENLKSREEIKKEIDFYKSKERTPEEIKKTLDEFRESNQEIYNIFRKIENILTIK